MIKTITSAENLEIKELVKLSDSKERKKQQRFIAEGIRTCTTMINAGMKPLQLYATREMLDLASTLCSDNLITFVTAAIIKKISQTTTPSGILGIFPIPKQPTEPLNAGIVLYQISDPGNMGALIRTCAALGKKTVIIVEGVDPWNPKVIQSTAGTIANVLIYQLDWQSILKAKGKLNLAALVVEGGKRPEELSLNNTLLVIGSEAHGLPDNIIEQCDFKITLPMPGKTESLNAAIAGSIAMYCAWAHKP